MQHNIVSFVQILVTTSFVFLSCTCGDGPNDSGGGKINPYIKQIKFSNPKKSGNFLMAVWRQNTLYAIQPQSKFILDGDYSLIQDTILEESTNIKNWTYIDINELGTKLLLIEYKYDTFYDIPTTKLYEYDIPSNQLQLLYDMPRNVATARYYPNDDTKIVYYSFGDSIYNGAGYYLRDKISQQDTLLFPYLSTAGIWETLHGFDIHPNGESILVPIHQGVGRFVHNKPPKLGVAYLKEQRLDTLNISFNFSFVRTGLWVRYNHDGSKILYCCFPDNAYGYVTNDNSEIGIIDGATLTKKLLDVNTNAETKHGSVQLAPNWSPDETAIVYGSGQVIESGQAGTRGLYILTKLE